MDDRWEIFIAESIYLYTGEYRLERVFLDIPPDRSLRHCKQTRGIVMILFLSMRHVFWNKIAKM